MSKLHRIAIMLAVVALASASCQKKDEEAQQEVPRPVLSVVAAETPASSLRLPGVVEPRMETQLGFRVLGRMIARNVNVGDLVKKDVVVAAIDPLTLELAVRSAQSDLDNAEAQLRTATTNEQRQRVLAEARTSTEAALEEAEQRRRTALASVAKARANLNRAQEQLGYAQLHAEFDGVVTATSAEIGQIVSAGQTVVTIARPDERDAVIDVPQAAAGQLRTGAPFEVTLQSDATEKASGVVREIAPEAESTTRTRRTKIALSNPSPAFRLGSVVTAWATISADPHIMLPSSAILKSESRTSVWVVDVPGKKVLSREVKIEGDIKPGGTVRIVEGVKPGDRVVVAGVNKLKDGQSIRIDQEISQ
jgi:membrane fusion protein, multidrug efflux system